MGLLVGFVLICLLWLTLLTVKDRKQKRKIEDYKIQDQENIIEIRRLVNEVEYLKMLLYGKKYEERKAQEAKEKGDNTGH